MATTDELEKKIGYEALVKLSAEWGGTRIYVPSTPARGNGHLTRAQAEKIRELRERRHWSVARIALAMATSERTVNKILGRHAPAPTKPRDKPHAA
jgi:hypothetical protein